MLRETKNSAVSVDADDYTKSTWHQGSILDDTDYDRGRTVSEENPTVLLTSDPDQSISLPSYPDFSSYEEEEEASNETDVWCGGVVQADVNVATNFWAGLMNVTVTHPVLGTDFGLVPTVTYQGKQVRT